MSVPARTLQDDDRDAARAQKTKNRVTVDSMESKIATADYWSPPGCSHMTVCALTTKAGFTLIGKSAPADPDNFNAELGAKLAREDAMRQLWRLEGYLLRNRLYESRMTKGTS
jgi:hypothetical protein